MAVNWSEIDGRLAENGAPGLLAMSPRRAMNLAYYRAVKYKNSEERDEFNASLSMTMVEYQEMAQQAAIEEMLERQRLVREHAEVG